MEHRSELSRSQARPSRIEPAFARRDRVPGPLQHLPRHAPCVRRLRQRPDHRLRPESRRGSRPRETAPRPAGRPRVVGISTRAHRLLRSIDSHHHDELLTGKEYAYDSMRHLNFDLSSYVTFFFHFFFFLRRGPRRVQGVPGDPPGACASAGAPPIACRPSSRAARSRAGGRAAGARALARDRRRPGASQRPSPAPGPPWGRRGAREHRKKKLKKKVSIAPIARGVKINSDLLYLLVALSCRCWIARRSSRSV